METINEGFLKKLCDLPGLPGFESGVSRLIKKTIEGNAESVRMDSLGNLYATKGSAKSGPHVMFAAHMDEVGLMVDRIDSEGFISFMPLGGIDPRILPAKRVRVGKENIPGMIGVRPPHLEEKENLSKVIPMSALTIDVGAGSKDEAEKYVEPGDQIVFDTYFEGMGELVKGKAFDDRLGCYALTELIKEDFDFPCTFVWTVQEEAGLRGAHLASRAVQPDFLIVLEGTGAGDVPVDKDVSRAPKLGKGPVVTLLDASAIFSKKFVDFVTSIADRYEIPWQYKRPLVGGTDAGAAVREKALYAVVVAIPCRYIHSPVAISSVKDIINTTKLVKSVSKNLYEANL